MTTNAPTRPARPRATGRTLRGLAVAVAVAPLLVLAACSGDAPITATTPTAPIGTTSDATGGPSSPSTTTTSTTPEPSPTTLSPKGAIKDSVLGHVITPTKVVVGLPWPGDHPIAEEHFELVGVQVKVQAGTRYSADITPAMFTLKTSAPDVVPATNEFKGALGQELGTVKRGKTATGWLIFKAEKGTATSLELQYNRPAYDVKTTGKSIKAQTFSVKLTP